MPEDMPADKWLSTLRGEKAVTPDGRLTVWFWEHPDDEDGFLAEVDGGGTPGKDGCCGRYSCPIPVLRRRVRGSAK